MSEGNGGREERKERNSEKDRIEIIKNEEE